MKNILNTVLVILVIACTFSCANDTSTANENATTENVLTGGQDAVVDDESQKDVVKVAVGSKDHTTLVAALKQAQLVDDLSNAGPFTVFAPTNAAFDAVPKETLDNLMKDENRADLENILQYHVYVGVLKPEYMQDGQTFNQVNGDNVTIKKTGDKLTVNGANIIASIPASNGIIHVVDAVLLPPAKK
ncbi:MAG: fasciclin domain-containing protein [Flavisolibacter sp.]